ncbi:hypothetical protein [Nocardia brasiliensis]|uniref:hypothetical protein n=1 Tax=Nocardia brasiliensis TaxID=37326 RepID=UPI0024561890|nr:hypothetical protein [Nocardia brasiliensis]
MTIDDPADDNTCRGDPRVISASPPGIRALLAVAILVAAFLNARMLMLLTGYADGDAQTALIPAIVSAAVVGLCWFRLRVTGGRR